MQGEADELEGLIEEQKADDESRYTVKDGRESNAPIAVLAEIDPRNQELAMPQEIIEARIEGECPRCGCEMDLDNEGGLCHNEECGFSF